MILRLYVTPKRTTATTLIVDCVPNRTNMTHSAPLSHQELLARYT